MPVERMALGRRTFKRMTLGRIPYSRMTDAIMTLVRIIWRIVKSVFWYFLVE